LEQKLQKYENKNIGTKIIEKQEQKLQKSGNKNYNKNLETKVTKISKF
jgi:hypothetical protein